MNERGRSANTPGEILEGRGVGSNRGLTKGQPRFGLRLPLCTKPDRVVEEAMSIEELGWDIAWIPDGQLDMYDCWVNAAAIKLNTTRLQLGLCVTNPLTRHPSVTACAASTVDQLGDGQRLLLGIGVGDSSVRPMGERVATLDELRDAIGFIRKLQTGDFLTRKGRQFHMVAGDGRVSPIYVSATGPRMLELAGEVADGVIALGGVSSAALSYVFDHVEAGAKRAGRSHADIDVVIGTWSYVSDDKEECLEQARPICAFFMIEGKQAIERAGMRIPSNVNMSGLYPDVIHAESWDLAIEKSKKWLPQDVVEEFVSKFLVVGSGEEIARKIQDLVDAGIRSFYIRGFSTYDFATNVAAAYSQYVFPSVRGGVQG